MSAPELPAPLNITAGHPFSLGHHVGRSAGAAVSLSVAAVIAAQAAAAVDAGGSQHSWLLSALPLRQWTLRMLPDVVYARNRKDLKQKLLQKRTWVKPQQEVVRRLPRNGIAISS